MLLHLNVGDQVATSLSKDLAKTATQRKSLFFFYSTTLLTCLHRSRIYKSTELLEVERTTRHYRPGKYLHQGFTTTALNRNTKRAARRTVCTSRSLESRPTRNFFQP